MLRQLPPLPFHDRNVLVGFDTGDDAAIYRVGDDLALVLTVDFFPPIVDDPWWFGAIAAANSLSDVYAMGGRPIAALSIAAFPSGLPPGVLAKVLAGAQEKAAEAGIAIVGGHTVDDDEPKYGLAVTGVVKPDGYIANTGAQPGDALVLSKPIGTGIITTAGKAQTAEPDVLDRAVKVMAALNAGASEAMLSVGGVNACTDITGFGLLGHLKAMAFASGVAARVSRSAVPVIPGALDLLEAGIAPGGTHRNLAGVAATVAWDDGIAENDRLLLADAQTSGGLLVSISAARADDLIAAMKRNGTSAAARVGEILDGEPGAIEVVA